MVHLGIGHVVVLAVLTSFLLASVSSQTAEDAVLDFDCRRDGSDCEDGAPCDVTTGACDCSEADTTTITSRDYKCRDNSPSGTCPSTCENNAQCVSSACNCGESYYGTECHMNRVQVDCDGANMFLNVNPDVTSFSGSIFVFNHEEKDACTLKTTPDESQLGDYVQKATDLEGFSLTLPHAGSDCGDITPENINVVNGTSYKSYKRQFMVRYLNGILTSLDQMVTAECRVSEGGSTIYSGGTVVNETNEVFTDVDVNTDVETVTMYIHHGDGSRIDGPVMLGEDIQLVFSLAPASGFKDFYISSCEANNTDTNEDSVKKLEFISDKCPSSAAFSLFRSSLTKEPAETITDPVVIRLDMKAFMFMGTFKQVAFVCDIVLCAETGNGLCQEGTCDGVVASKNATNNEVTEVDETVDPTTAPSDNSTIDDNNTGNFTDDSNSTTDGSIDSEVNGTDTTGNTTETTGNATETTGNATVTDDTSATNATTNTTNTTATNATAETASANATSDAGTGGSRRRRRSASGDHQKAYTVMTVYGPGGLGDEDIKKLQNSLESKDCMAQPEIVACIGILSTAVVLLLTVSVMLTFNQLRAKPGQRTSRHKVDPNCVPPVECLRIPRLELHHPYNNISNQRC